MDYDVQVWLQRQFPSIQTNYEYVAQRAHLVHPHLLLHRYTSISISFDVYISHIRLDQGCIPYSIDCSFCFLPRFRGFDLKGVNKIRIRVTGIPSTRFRTMAVDVSCISPEIMSSSKIYMENVNVRVKIWFASYRICLLEIEYPIRNPVHQLTNKKEREKY